jgi:hypothetical protein
MHNCIKYYGYKCQFKLLDILYFTYLYSIIYFIKNYRTAKITILAILMRISFLYIFYNMLSVGSRAQVWHGTAKATGYGKKGLRKSQLKKTKHGRIVSRKMSARAKKENRLGKNGWKTKKGVFGSFHVSDGKTRKKRRKRRKRKKRKGCRTRKGRYKKC